MDANLKDLLRPEIINTMNGLELIARIIVEGFMSGGNRSSTIGFGQEFSQYRNYEQGDDLRQLDWKMYARSERYYVKQAEIETNITVQFFLDASASMAHTENNLSKLQYAKVIIAAIAYLARKQGDLCALYSFNTKKVKRVEARFENQQFQRLLHHLLEIQAEGKWPAAEEPGTFKQHGKELIIFISDLYDTNGDVIKFIQQLKTLRNEVLVFHVLGNEELNLSTSGSFTIEDLETNERVKIETASQRQAYTNKVSTWVDGLRSTFLNKGIYYHQFLISDPPQETLQKFLKSRKLLAS